MATCKAPGCTRDATRIGFCGPHFGRYERHGDPLKGQTFQGEPEAFMKNLIADPPAHCVEWPFAKDPAGYGRWRLNKVYMTAHRIALVLYSGEDKGKGYQAAHEPLVCHNKSCVNPKHLRWATRVENEADKALDGTNRMWAKRKDAKLTPESAQQVREDTRSYREIAAEHGISKGLVSHIKSGRAWRT